MGFLTRDSEPSGKEAERGARKTAVLTFHALESGPDAICFPPCALRSGLHELAAKGLRTERLEEVAARVRSGQCFSPQSFAITFDDGYQTVYTQAFPVLQDLGMTATVFLCTGEGAASGTASRLPSLGRFPMLDWAEVREMHRAGISFGAHTLTHPDLTQVTFARAEAEMRDSQARIEDALGTPVRTFAYPFGRFDRRGRDLASRYFDLACSDKLGLVAGTSDVLALPRVDAYYLRSGRMLASLPSPLFAAYIAARAVPRGLRRALTQSGAH